MLLLSLPSLPFVVACEVAPVLALALADLVASSQSGFIEFRMAVARSKMCIS